MGEKNRLHLLQSRLLVLLDVEQLVELGDLEDLVNLRVDAAQDQPAAGGIHLLVQGDELAQRGARQVFDVAEVQQQFAAPQLVHQAKQLFADQLNVLLVQDLLIR